MSPEDQVVRLAVAIVDCELQRVRLEQHADAIRAQLADLGEPCMCGNPRRHDPHVYYVAIAGGEPGPVPTVTCVCPGRP